MSSISLVIAATTDSNLWAQIVRFWSFQDASVRTATAGVLLLAISSGTLGCFIVLRRLSLFGDSLGAALLPGVSLGVLVTWLKHPRLLPIGAPASDLLASVLLGVTRPDHPDH